MRILNNDITISARDNDLKYVKLSLNLLSSSINSSCRIFVSIHVWTWDSSFSPLGQRCECVWQLQQGLANSHVVMGSNPSQEQFSVCQ